jgi:hypothetical protein
MNPHPQDGDFFPPACPAIVELSKIALEKNDHRSWITRLVMQLQTGGALVISI